LQRRAEWRRPHCRRRAAALESVSRPSPRVKQ
jgi:hypothetical protein